MLGVSESKAQFFRKHSGIAELTRDLVLVCVRLVSLVMMPQELSFVSAPFMGCLSKPASTSLWSKIWDR